MIRESCCLMDTDVTVAVAGPRVPAAAAARAALARMGEIAVKFNALDPESPLYAFNHRGEPLADPEILGLVAQGLEISRASGGAFDMTVVPLLRLWGFYSTPHVPADREIAAALACVGYRHLGWKDGQLTKDAAGVQIGLGGIAKGYALAEAARVLRENGTAGAIIDAGGDIYALGRHGARCWHVGIRNPAGPGVVGSVRVADTAVMGSGDYERFFIRDGRRYHHILDPHTGSPTDGVAAVTVMGPDPVAAQAWAKVPFVLGHEQGLALMEKVPGMRAVVILSGGDKVASRGMRL